MIEMLEMRNLSNLDYTCNVSLLCELVFKILGSAARAVPMRVFISGKYLFSALLDGAMGGVWFSFYLQSDVFPIEG